MPKTNYVCLSDQAIWLQLGTLKGAWKNYVFSALGLDRDLGFSRGTPSGIPPRSQMTVDRTIGRSIGQNCPKRTNYVFKNTQRNKCECFDEKLSSISVRLSKRPSYTA